MAQIQFWQHPSPDLSPTPLVSRGEARFSELGGPGRVVVDLSPLAPSFTHPKSSDLRESYELSCWRLKGVGGPDP